MSQGMKAFYVVIALVLGTIGYRGLTQKPVRANVPPTTFTCVEFISDADAARFRDTGVIPSGSRISNYTDECKGIRLDSK